MENQGKSDEQIENSYKLIFGALIGITACLAFSLMAAIVCSVWPGLCG